jgi:2-methylcitrate dehydratase PrpD
MTVRKKAGGELTKDAALFKGHQQNPMSRAERLAKFNRVCDHMRVEPQQRQRALAHWSNLREINDIAMPIQNLAKFGQSMPL